MGGVRNLPRFNYRILVQEIEEISNFFYIWILNFLFFLPEKVARYLSDEFFCYIDKILFLPFLLVGKIKWKKKSIIYVRLIY